MSDLEAQMTDDDEPPTCAVCGLVLAAGAVCSDCADELARAGVSGGPDKGH